MKQLKVEIYECVKHGIDYRITCDACQEKYEKISKIIQNQINIHNETH